MQGERRFGEGDFFGGRKQQSLYRTTGAHAGPGREQHGLPACLVYCLYMRKEALAQWLKKRTAGIKKEASAVEPGFFPETVHQFRTETKKLRAMLRLISM